MNGKWFLIYAFLSGRETRLKLELLEATTQEEAMIEAQKKWAVITWGEPKRSRINPSITQLTNTISLFN
jgi:hypothetical protein